MPGFWLASEVHVVLFSPVRSHGQSEKLRFGDVEFEKRMRHPSEGVRWAMGSVKRHTGSHVGWA